MDFKKLLKYILGTIFIGSFFSLFIFDSFKIYEGYEKPFLSPPGIVFPIVWTVLYILMGISFISSAIVFLKKKKDTKIIYLVLIAILLGVLTTWSAGIALVIGAVIAYLINPIEKFFFHCYRKSRYYTSLSSIHQQQQGIRKYRRQGHRWYHRALGRAFQPSYE